MKQIFVHRTATLVIFLALILVACGTLHLQGSNPLPPRLPLNRLRQPLSLSKP